MPCNIRRGLKLFLRILGAILLLSVHYLAFPIPLVEGFASYILLCNPPWFRAFLERLDA